MAKFSNGTGLLTDFVQRLPAGGLVKRASEKRATHIDVCGGQYSGLVIKKEINDTIRQLVLPDFYIPLGSEN